MKVIKKPATGSRRAPATGEPARDGGAAGTAAAQEFVDERGEPRFISEAYFMRFKFEPGNYYLVGRERFEGHDVLRIEYYPTRLFSDEQERAKDPAADKDEGPRTPPRARYGGRD